MSITFSVVGRFGATHGERRTRRAGIYISSWCLSWDSGLVYPGGSAVVDGSIEVISIGTRSLVKASGVV
jgi:hypothetical protein